ncbi:MAG: DUF1203 domain-containing protein [Pseudomonadota bacterium]
MSIRFSGMSTEEADALRAGGPDANGQAAARAISDGEGIPCRHCLKLIPKGEAYLVFALRPFSTIQPYAEVGPAFVCQASCQAHCDAALSASSRLPEVFADSPTYIVRGYRADETIVYGSGGVVPNTAIIDRSRALFDDPKICFVHVRSASNNCWQARIDRDS